MRTRVNDRPRRALLSRVVRVSMSEDARETHRNWNGSPLHDPPECSIAAGAESPSCSLATSSVLLPKPWAKGGVQVKVA
jgi:hypothetical protein